MERMHSKPSNQDQNIPTNHKQASLCQTPSSEIEKNVRCGSNRKKERPSFIALPGTVLGELPREGETDKPEHPKTSKLQGNGVSEVNSQEHLSEQVENANAKGHGEDCKQEEVVLRRCQDNTNPKKMNSEMSSNSDSKKTYPKQPSEDHKTLLAKISSRFLSPEGKISSPCDSVSSLDSIPWNMEGTETIVENPAKRSKIANSSNNMEKKRLSFIERELETVKEENKQLKASLEEAGRLNAQWRSYHQERQGYVDKLLSTIHGLQQRQISPPNALLKACTDGKTMDEIKRLKDNLSRAQAEHQEHVSLLQMQVKAHQDDWEAERAEKKLERTGRQEAEERAALLLQEVELLQQKLTELEGKTNLCSRCGVLLRVLQTPSHQEAIREEGFTADNRQAIGHFETISSNETAGYSRKVAPKGRGSHQNCTDATERDRCKQNGKPPSFSGNRVFLHSSLNQVTPHWQHRSAFQRVPSKDSKLNLSSDYNDEPTTNAQDYIEIIEAGQDLSPKIDKEVESPRTTGNGSVRSRNSLKADAALVVTKALKPSQEMKYLLKSRESSQARSNAVASNKFKQSPAQKVDSQTKNMPLKGWIPVSMIHQIAIGSTPSDDLKNRMHYATAEESRDSLNKNFDSINSPTLQDYPRTPSNSRESSLLSCTSFETQSAQRQENENLTSNHSSDKSIVSSPELHYHKHSSKNREDDEKKAKHRARHILANAIPISPCSSGPTTPAGNPSRYNSGSLGHSFTVVQSNSQPKTSRKAIADQGLWQPAGTIYDSSFQTRHGEPRSSKMFEKKTCKAPAETIAPTNETSKMKSNEKSQLLCDSEVIEKEVNRKLSDPHSMEKTNQSNSNQVSSSTSNETSRSSSPGMSLTTFALNSDGKGIPGAICFSLHPDIQPCLKSGILSSIDQISPKKELAISRVEIEPRSPKLSKSPIEISTKEHWWDANDTSKSAVDNKNGNEVPDKTTLVNSAVVTLQDSGRKESDSQRTARAIPSNELAFHRKRSQEEKNNQSIANEPSKVSSHSNTFSYTPAVNCVPQTDSQGHPQANKLKSIASKNIASAIISYEIAAKGDKVEEDRRKWSSVDRRRQKKFAEECPESVATLTSKEIICPSCQLLIPKEQHIFFLDHFETCRGPKFADM